MTSTPPNSPRGSKDEHKPAEDGGTTTATSEDESNDGKKGQGGEDKMKMKNQMHGQQMDQKRASFDVEDPYEEKMLELDSPIVPRFYRSHTKEKEITIERCGKQIKPVRPGMDSLNTEYLYYTVLLKNVIPMMSRRQDRKKVTKWVEKLSSPAYQTARLRVKRNKYMLKLCLNAINDEVLGIFALSPPEGVLPHLEEQAAETPPARWEMDNYWFELIKDLPVELGRMGCSAHAKCGENRDEQGSQPVAGALLDHEFRFFLYMARPYTILLDRPVDKARLAIWLQTLAKIRSCSCLAMKGIRNDYIQALLGYLQELRLTGPFQEFPPLLRPLPPLAELSKLDPVENPKMPFTDPSHPLVEEFITAQPRPENGAYCYIAITGDPTANVQVDPLPI
ncbi:hypothetical protein GE061_010787 [Apolygus lucorum]|uniref:DUF4485 domain-containing protein n=1 Tax=Apolygus lucorum TaxID=248454 RepID=A0A6A4ITT4_APOLU|nr:hypothetical protein GE061_010787 [Apolygus lucorum]